MVYLDNKYFAAFREAIGTQLSDGVVAFDFSDIKIDFSHRIIASAVFSSNIEGNTVNLNTFLNWKILTKSKPNKEIKEINDLIEAYQFAQTNVLNEKNMIKAHQLLSTQLLIKSKRGKYRQDKVGVFDEGGLVYLAIEPEFLKETMHSFFQEIMDLTKAKMTLEEAFYYASFIHLRFVHIHPFADGNGRMARLLEKWFLTQQLGTNFWKIPSEKFYKEQLTAYYANINLGVNYYELNYNKALPFLKMLAQCV
jgi:Fic family protein